MKYTITVMDPSDYYTVRRAFCHYFYGDRALLNLIDVEEWKTLQLDFVGGVYTRWIKDTVQNILNSTKCKVYVVIEEEA